MAPIDILNSTDSEGINTYEKFQKSFVEEKCKNDINYHKKHKLGGTSFDYFNDFVSYLNSKNKALAVGLASFNNSEKTQVENQIVNSAKGTLSLIEHNKKTLTNIFKKEFGLNSTSSTVSSINDREQLEKLIKNKKSREIFLIEKGLIKEEELKNLINLEDEKLLKKIGLSAAGMKKLDDERKKRLIELFSTFGRKVNFSDLEDIFTVLDEKSKENVLKFFIVKVSLAELKEIDSSAYNQITKKIISKIKSDFGVNDKDAKEIFDGIRENEIFVELDEIANFKADKFINSDTIKNKITEDFNNDFKKAGLLDNEVAKLNFDEFIAYVKKSPEISDDIKAGIDKLKAGNFFTISEAGLIPTTYSIEKVDFGATTATKTILLKDLTDNSNVRHTQVEFFNVLRKISSNPSLKIDFSENKPANILENGSLSELKQKLDRIDSEGASFGLDKDKTAIFNNKTEDGERFIFLIKDINEAKKTITVDQGGLGNTTVSFDNFYQIMEKNGFKRTAKINNFNDVGVSSAKYENGKIFLDKDKDKKIPIKYFSNQDYRLEIKEISDNSIKYTLGEIETQKDKNGNIKEKKIKKSWTATNFTQFKKDIDELKLFPDESEYNEKVEEKNGEQLKRNAGLGKKFMSGLSIAEIIASGTFIIDGITEKLKTGNELKSIRFAQKFGGMFGKDVKLALQSKAEAKENELIEQLANNMQNLDSSVMIEQIEHILKNGGSETYEILAALLATIKYGHLYPKGLKKYEGSFMWYKILGGTDAQIKQKREEKNAGLPPDHPDYVNFREEDILIGLLKEHGGKGKIPSKFWKKIAIAMQQNTNKEYDGGKEMAGGHANVKHRYQEFENFLDGREYAGAVGALEVLLQKNASPKEMHKAPFVFAISGLGKNIDNILKQKIKALLFTYPYTSLKYCDSEFGSKQYKQFIETLIRNKGTPEMLKDYQAMINSGPNTIVKKAGAFWDKHGKELAKYLSFEDDYIILHQNEPGIAEFFNTSKGIVTDDNYTFGKEQMADKIYEKNKISKFGAGIGTLRMDTLGGFSTNDARITYDSIVESIDNVMKMKATDPEKAYKAFKTIYEPFEKQVTITASKYAKDGKFSKDAIYTRDLAARQLTPYKGSGDRPESFYRENFNNYRYSAPISVGGTSSITRIKTEDILRQVANDQETKKAA